MKSVTLILEDYLYHFYEKIGKQAGNVRAEKVMADALFRLAGELSMNALKKGTDQKNS